MSTPAPAPVHSPRIVARQLYWQGWRIVRIAEYLDQDKFLLYTWKKRDGWDEALPLDRVESTTEARYVQLVVKDGKEGKDYKEIDLLGRQMERFARIKQYQNSGNEADLNPVRANSGHATAAARRERGPKRKNDLDEAQVEQVRTAFWESLFEYQRGWYHAGEKYRIREILKSRQIGATWYFAREAIVDALITGKNKIFLSASKAQAHIFRNYIIAFVREACEVELKGSKDAPIILGNGAELYFLGTNSATAQGYHGDVYLDEFFWIHRFAEFRKVISGMAMHKKWKQTYFSTPSSIAHEAYPFWTGEQFNRNQPKEKRVAIDTSHAALKAGKLCADKKWRQIVTVYDAVEGGCDLFDVDALRDEYLPEEFDNLLMCGFVDDTASAFPLASMQSCMVDSWEVWRDVKPFAPRPVGNAQVWFGYDPGGDSEGGDGGGLIIVLPSKTPGGTHRILEKHRLYGDDYQAQADFLKKCAGRFKVSHIGIDNNGMGEGVAQIVEKWFPTLVRYRYTPEVKSRMVMQAQQMMRRGRLEWDAGWADLAQAFMAIRRVPTAGGGQLTYKARRSSTTGHSELAWATMHALHHEPIDGSPAGGESVMELY